MAWRLPTFNLTVNIWRNSGVPPSGPPDEVTVGNLTPGKRGVDDAHTAAPGVMYLLLPAGTDVRSFFTVGQSSAVEVPAGTGRYYKVEAVDDVAKGFSNEHRFCIITQAGTWPIPIP